MPSMASEPMKWPAHFLHRLPAARQRFLEPHLAHALFRYDEHAGDMHTSIDPVIRRQAWLAHAEAVAGPSRTCAVLVYALWLSIISLLAGRLKCCNRLHRDAWDPGSIGRLSEIPNYYPVSWRG